MSINSRTIIIVRSPGYVEEPQAWNCKKSFDPLLKPRSKSIQLKHPCKCMYISVYVYIYIYLYTYIYIHIHTYICVRTCIRIRIHICIYVHAYVQVYENAEPASGMHLKYFQYRFLTINCHMLYLVFEFIRHPKVYTFSFIVGSIIRLSQKV